MWSFYKELLKGFRSVGAFSPSSPFLASAIAEMLPKPFQGALVELGPGTGAITKKLISSGISPAKIIVVEHSAEFVEHMQNNFKEITTIQGSAEHLAQLLNEIQQPINAIVSSLPLRSFPKQTVQNILEQVNQVLSSGGYYIQFTYFKKESPMQSLEEFYHLQSKHIMLNLPPARIDVFKKK